MIYGALLVFVFELFVFHAYFARHRAPYFPRHFDQLASYKVVYKGWELVHSQGFVTGMVKTAASSPATGKAVPILATLSSLVFGKHRFAGILVNFAFFLAGQLMVFLFLQRRAGWPLALVGWGLFLAAGTHYYWQGGLDDLRHDYAAMVVFGGSVLALSLLVDKPSRRSMLLLGLMAAVAVVTRAILSVYLLGTLMILLVLFGGARILDRENETAKRRFHFIGLATGLSTLIFVLYIWSHWTKLHNYYVVGHLVGPEKKIRAAEHGLFSIIDHLMFYPLSIYRDHLGPYVIMGLGILLLVFVGLVLWAFATRRPIHWTLRPIQTWLTILVCVSAVVSVVVILTVNIHKSPVVGGVTTIPLILLFSLIFTEAFQRVHAKRSLQVVGLIFAVAGLSLFTYQYQFPNISEGERRELEQVNTLLAGLSSLNPLDVPLKVAWLTIRQDLNRGTLWVYLAEHGESEPDRRFTNFEFGIYPRRQDEVMGVLEKLDVVVAPIEMPPKKGFEFPFISSVRKYRPAWQAYLDKHMLLKFTTRISDDWTFGVYLRCFRLVSINDSGYDEGATSRSIVLGEEPIVIKAYNFDSVARPVQLIAAIGPESIEALASGKLLEYQAGEVRHEIMVGQQTDGQLIIPWNLTPGANTLRLSCKRCGLKAVKGQDGPEPTGLSLHDFRLVPITPLSLGGVTPDKWILASGLDFRAFKPRTAGTVTLVLKVEAPSYWLAATKGTPLEFLLTTKSGLARKIPATFGVNTIRIILRESQENFITGTLTSNFYFIPATVDKTSTDTRKLCCRLMSAEVTPSR